MTDLALRDDFIAALAPAKRNRPSGDGRVLVTCWGHDDHNPSCNVWVDDKGKVTFYCHAGCDRRHLEQSLPPQAKRIAEDSWGVGEQRPDLHLVVPQQPKPHVTANPNEIARYDYHDADGELVFYKTRHTDKTFVQYQPNGRRGRGGYPGILYRLPEVKAAVAAGQPIHIVEGEKDADRLAAHGLIATTNADGAGKWNPDIHGAHLHGAHIVILPDNDDIGHAHAADIQTDLLGKAASIKEIDLPVPPKGDVSDYLDRHSPDELLELIRTAPTIGRTLPEYFVNWDTVWDVEPDELLIEPIFLEGRGHAIYAKAKTGKSLIILSLIAEAITHNPDLRVLYLDYEMGMQDLSTRLEKMGYGRHSDLSRIYYGMFPPIAPLDTPEGGDELMALCDLVMDGAPHATKLLVIIDTISRAVQGEENSADTYRNFYRHTGMALKARKYTWARADHAGKDSGLGQRGSSAKNDDVDVVWEIKRAKDDPNYITLNCTFQRVGTLPNSVTMIQHDHPLRFEFKRGKLLTQGVLDLARRIHNDFGIKPGTAQNVAADRVQEALRAQNVEQGSEGWLTRDAIKDAAKALKDYPTADWSRQSTANPSHNQSDESMPDPF